LKPDIQTIQLYKTKYFDLKSKEQELEDIKGDVQEARNEYEKLRKKRSDEFMCGFIMISARLKEMYQVRNSYIFISKANYNGWRC
jgi:chromosome segregation ATPase